MPLRFSILLSTLAPLCAQSLSDLRRDDALAVIELQPSIDAAIDRGIAWLLDQQQRDGSFFGHNEVFTGGQTALSAYTMMKAGLPPTHQGVRRALAHLTTVRPTKVYAAGTMLMALAESGEAQHRPQMEKIVADLLEWQRGSWPYPITPQDRGLHGDVDLSITQFALLGLRAAARAGIKIPADAWLDAMRATLRYQERSRGADARDGKANSAGFRYRAGGGDPVTGGMTTAGLSALCIARNALGKLPLELARDVDAALVAGRLWLDQNFDVRENPGFHGHRWVYYLYGLERASALLELGYWADRPWYLEGARVLLEKQNPRGAWPFPEGESDTCFAILFLKRATAPTTGKPKAGPRSLESDDAGSDVAFKVTGDDDGRPYTLLVTRIGSRDTTRCYLVDQVEFTVNDAPVVTVDGKGKPFAGSADFAGRWLPTTNGEHGLAVRVRARRADAEGNAVGEPVALTSPLVKVTVKEVLEDWMLAAATWRSRNLLVRDETTATASSQLDDGRAAARAVDGFEGSAWICAKDDPAPRLALVFEKPVPARTLQLSQANGARGWLRQFELVRKVHVFVNGSKTPVVAELAAGELAPTRIDLGKTTRIKRLDLAIVERAGADATRGAAGFAEVALEK